MNATVTLLLTLVWLAFVAVAPVPVAAQTLASVKPEQVGLSSEQLGRIAAMLRADSRGTARSPRSKRPACSTPPPRRR
jgi:Na+/H+-dicarboxylate symporter